MITYDKFKQLRDFSVNKIIPAFEDAGYTERASKLKSCGDFTITKKCKNCGTYYFDGWFSCKDRFCPLCQKKKSLTYIAKLMPILIDLANKGYKVQLMNFTIKDNSNLKYGLDMLNSAFRLIQHDNKVFAKEFKKRFPGGIKSLEIKKGKYSGEWHPHLHCIVVKKDFSEDFDFMKNAWEYACKKVTGKNDKLGSVWLKGINANNRSELLKSLVESLKYVTKYDGDETKQSHTLALNSLDSNSIKELVNSTNNVRAVSTWGLLHNLKTEEETQTLDNLVDKVCLICNSKNFEKDYLQTDTNSRIVTDFNPSILNDKLKEAHEFRQSKLNKTKIVQMCFEDFMT